MFERFKPADILNQGRRLLGSRPLTNTREGIRYNIANKKPDTTPIGVTSEDTQKQAEEYKIEGTNLNTPSAEQIAEAKQLCQQLLAMDTEDASSTAIESPDDLLTGSRSSRLDEGIVVSGGDVRTGVKTKIGFDLFHQ